MTSQALPAPSETTLVLRTCAADLTSTNDFRWPETGPITCPDWQPTRQCGNGLHGLPWGVGHGGLLNWDADAKWLVVAVATDTLVDLDGKVKFPAGDVVFCGDRAAALSYLDEHGAADRPVVGATRTAGDSGTATAGYRGTATAGDSGTATAGDSGTATAGDSGTATAGDRGTATAGYRGTATAGDRGTVAVHWYDAAKRRYRVAIGEVGEDGIEPDVAYKVANGKLVRAESAAA